MSQEPSPSRTAHLYVWIRAKTYRLVLFSVLLALVGVLLGEALTGFRYPFIYAVVLFVCITVGGVLGDLSQRRRTRSTEHKWPK